MTRFRRKFSIIFSILFSRIRIFVFVFVLLFTVFRRRSSRLRAVENYFANVYDGSAEPNGRDVIAIGRLDGRGRETLRAVRVRKTRVADYL